MCLLVLRDVAQTLTQIQVAPYRSLWAHICRMDPPPRVKSAPSRFPLGSAVSPGPGSDSGRAVSVLLGFVVSP